MKLIGQISQVWRSKNCIILIIDREPNSYAWRVIELESPQNESWLLLDGSLAFSLGRYPNQASAWELVL